MAVAFAGGLEVGSGLYKLYEDLMGDTLGGDIYDLFQRDKKGSDGCQ
jgi:hypothetical protein